MKSKVLCAILQGDAINFSIRKIVLLMKLLILMTVVFCLQAWSNGHGQMITLSVKNAPLENVFKQIRKQSPYSFIYAEEELAGSHPVSFEVKAARIEEVLQICFLEQPLSYTIDETHIIIKKKNAGAKLPVYPLIDIKGKVSSENGAVLAGATITVKGTNRTTITDENGEFFFAGLAEDAILVIGSVGHQTLEYKLNGKNEIGVRLKANVGELGDVTVKVNTGYQELPKERATGSFTQIDNATLNQQVGSNILNRLDGVASGVLFPKQYLQDGPKNGFMIRGLSTINGPKEPLIVVDNFPYEGNINNINPNDIESVTILKDAAASSIWGAKAGNGVVVITTKKGHFNQPLKISLNTGIIISGKPDLSYLRQINPDDYIDVETFLFNQGYYDGTLNNTYSLPAVSPVVEILTKQQAGLLTQTDAVSQINTYRNIDARDQYSKYIYQKAITQQYAVSVNGGSGNIAYYLSAGYDKTNDLLDANDDRITVRSENLYKPLTNLLVSFGVQYTQANSSGGKPGYGIRTGQWLIPYLNFVDPSGNPLPVATNYRQAYTDTAGAGKLLDWNYYPLEDWKSNVTKTGQQDLLANIGLNYQFIKGLSVDLKYLFERQTATLKNQQNLQSYTVRELINRFAQLDRSTGSITYIVPLGGILGVSNTTLESQNIRAQLNYSHSWKKHSLNAIGGGETRQTRTTGNSNIYYGYNENTGITSNVDLVNSYPTFINGSYNTIPGGGSLTDRLNRFVSFFGNAAYTYYNKYTLSVSGRRDASNLFGVNTNNKWEPLWSAGTSWELSKESFYHSDFLPYIRLRTTYGVSGNTDPARTGVVTLVYNDPLPPSNLPSTRINQFPNPDLRWEKVKIINIGLDFQSRKRLIEGSIEGYFKKGIDLFGAAPFDPTAGLNTQSTLTRNIANMKGTGLDFTVNSKILDRQMKWNTTLLLSYNMSKATNYYVDSNLRSGSFINTGFIVSPLPGKPLYSIVAYRWAGLDAEGNPQGYIGKEVSKDYYTITQNTRKEDLVYKSALPKIFGSLINTIGWKKFNLTINVSYRLGYYFMKPSVNYSSLFSNGASIGTSDFSGRWRNPGDEKNTNIPSMIYPADDSRDIFYNYSEILIKKADNVKLHYINLSYDFEKMVWRKMPFQQLELYVNASNLGILWRANKDGIDPDYISLAPPPGKTFAIGVKANF